MLRRLKVWLEIRRAIRATRAHQQSAWAMLWPMVGEALISLSGNRLRSFLAMLGIIIGVASVVMMLAVGSGSKRVIENAINSLGTNQLVIMPAEGNGVKKTQPVVLTMKDVIAVSQLPLVQNSAPASYPKNLDVSAGKLSLKANCTAITPEYLSVRSWEFTEGEAFTNADVLKGSRVVIIGSTVADKLFPGQEALGRNIDVNKIPFRVVGVLKSKGQALDGRDQDSVFFVPMSTGRTYLWDRSLTSLINMIYVQVVSADAMEEAVESVTEMLRNRFKLLDSQENNFAVYNLTAIKQVAADANKAFTVLLQAIASISLLVGSIGIMNIMLVTVTERTREIGIRKAIGATERQILVQFLMEAVILSFAGSVTGLILGFGGGWAAYYFAFVPVEFSINSVLMSLIMSVGIGVASGLYPAWKASRMQPIEALRTIGG